MSAKLKWYVTPGVAFYEVRTDSLWGGQPNLLPTGVIRMTYRKSIRTWFKAHWFCFVRNLVRYLPFLSIEYSSGYRVVLK